MVNDLELERVALAMAFGSIVIQDVLEQGRCTRDLTYESLILVVLCCLVPSIDVRRDKLLRLLLFNLTHLECDNRLKHFPSLFDLV